MMQSIEEQALATSRLTLPVWFRYVDDTITALHDDDIDRFHNHLNSQNRDIQFTKEIDEKGTLSFLDCLVRRDNDELIENPPTLTDYSTNHPTTLLHTKPPPSRRWLDMHNLSVIHQTLYPTRTSTYNTCSVRTTTTLTSSNSTPTKTTK